MHILVILGHPDPASFNHAIAGSVCEALVGSGHTVTFHDLAAEGFDPCLPAEEIPQDGVVSDMVRRHCDELRAAEGIVIVHPNWWGQPPAILKGWIDRIIRPGVAYRFVEGDSGEGVPVGLLDTRAVLVLNTSNTPFEREMQAFGNPLEALWKRCVFDLCGVTNVHRHTFRVIVTSSPQQRAEWLREAAEWVRELFPKDEIDQNA